MARTSDPDRLVRALDFPQELGLGLMLNGTHLSVVRRQVLAATATPTSALPDLALLAGGVRQSIPRPTPTGLVNGQGIYLWETNTLDDGRYELVSYLKYRTGTLWRQIEGKIEVNVESGCLVRYAALAVTTGAGMRPLPLDTSPAAMRERMRRVSKALGEGGR